MRAQTIDVKQAMGRILCSTIFRPGGKKLLAKGHVISEEDARMLETEGLAEVWVTELEDGEIGEDEAVMEVATEIGCGSLEIRLAAGGRANLFATESCCVLVDDELLKQINCTSSVAIATSLNFSFATPGATGGYRQERPICRFEIAIGGRNIDRERAWADFAGPAHPHA